MAQISSHRYLQARDDDKTKNKDDLEDDDQAMCEKQAPKYNQERKVD